MNGCERKSRTRHNYRHKDRTRNWPRRTCQLMTSHGEAATKYSIAASPFHRSAEKSGQEDGPRWGPAVSPSCHTAITNWADPLGRKVLTCNFMPLLDWHRRPWTVSTTCAMWYRETGPRSGLVGVLARQSGIAASRSCLLSRVHTFICHDLSHAPCETSPCLRRRKQVRHVWLHVPLLRRLHVRVSGPPASR